MASGASGGTRKDLRRELSILERSFPRHGEHCFRVILASPEELVCRFVDNNKTYNLQCSISVSASSIICLRCMPVNAGFNIIAMFACRLWSVNVNGGVNVSHLQPNYPVVMPIWITENSEKFIVDLIAELNMAEEPSATSQSTPASHTHLVCIMVH